MFCEYIYTIPLYINNFLNPKFRGILHVLAKSYYVSYYVKLVKERKKECVSKRSCKVFYFIINLNNACI